MKVPLSWLRELVDITIPADELAHRLTMAGLEVGEVITIGGWEKCFVGYVEKVEPHPNADRLTLCTVSTGNGTQRVVCGAPNVAAGQKIAFARVGARLIDAHSGKASTLKAAKIRGVVSEGMVCSQRELGLGEEHDGIIVLPEDAPLGMPLTDYLGDQILDLEPTPNRVDWLSLLGVAYEVAALTGAQVHLPEVTYPEEGMPISGKASVEIRAPDLCPRYTASLIKGVAVGPSPRWLQERLIRADMRPINNVVDVTNYVMMEYGQPLHAFDYETLLLRRIRVRRAYTGEVMETLDGVTRRLTSENLVIADDRDARALGGVIGSIDSEITEGTTDVFLESASFNPTNNRQTAQHFRLRTEATVRFEKGLRPELPEVALRRATHLIQRVAGGTVARGIIDEYPGQRLQREMDKADIRGNQQVPRGSAAQWVIDEDPEQRLKEEVDEANIRDKLVRNYGTPEAPGRAHLGEKPYWAGPIFVNLTQGRIKQVLGVEIAPAKAGEVLTSLGFECKDTGEGTLEVLTPYWRSDVSMEDDLVEEVARIIGYDDIPTTMLSASIPGHEAQPMREFREGVRDLLVREGLQEVISYSAVSLEALKRARAVGDEGSLLEVANPMSIDFQYMRPTLRASLLRTLSANLSHQRGPVSIFEIGRVYLPRAEDLPLEVETAAGILHGPRGEEGWLGSGDGVDFYDAKGVVEALLRQLGARGEFEPLEDSFFHPGKAAALTVNGSRVGALGEVHPVVAEAFEVDGEAVYFEMDLLPLLEVLPERARGVKPLARYPASLRDLSLLVDRDVPAARVRSIIESQALVERAVLFDAYEGEGIPPGKSSLAYRLYFQSPSKTLSSEEVGKALDKVVRALQREVGAVLRGGEGEAS